jgi:hypothetical protein
MFTTLVRWSGAEVPNGRVIDGVDQRAFFEGKQETSNRDGYPFWMGANKGRLVITVTDGAAALRQFFVLAARRATCAKTPLSCVPSSRNQMQRSVPSLCTATTVILGPPEFS